jgi:uncharacterized protein (DUF427 family)
MLEFKNRNYLKFETSRLESDILILELVMKAIWNETVVAESGQTVVVEGNHYFPPASLKTEYFRKSETHTTCHWKGEASYYDIVVNGKANKDAAWYYSDPSDAAKEIKGHVAFWRGVQVTG